MKRKWFVIGLALMMVLSVFLAACNEKKDGNNGASDGKPVDGGKITIAETAAFVGKFNPIMWEDETDSHIVNRVFEPLWKENEKTELEPRLAEKWEYSPDGKFFTIHMRKDVKWHDGKPITADDMIFTWEAIADPEYTGVRFDYVEVIKGAKEKKEKKANKISGIAKVDDYTIKVELARPYANFEFKLWSWPMPKHVFEKVKVKDLANHEATRTKVVGSGPFKLKEAKPNEYVILEKNKDYYRKGKPHVDQLVFKVLSQDVAVGALKKGEIDFYPGLSAKDFDNLKKDKKLVTKEAPAFTYSYLGLDNANPKYKDKRVRQAITYAINRKGIVDGLMKGHGYLINQHIPKLSWAYNPDLENAYPYDPNKAKQLMAQAGYKDANGDGLVEDPQGKPYKVIINYPSDSTTSARMAPILVDNLKKAGINAEIAQPKEWKTFLELQDQGKLETFLMAWGLDVDPDPAGIWRSNDEFNKLNFKNPENDKLIEQQQVERDRNKRKELLKKWTELISEEAPQVFLYGRTEMAAWNPRVKGVVWDYRGGLPEDWWVSDK
ncbi:peptide-binding protein [Thermoflavimicrobium dichotomicum]|uniref:Peptide/nickel transport system substrate-binding protein n=1 Tax=Thermoflavimicrobium dichotomicum TaxID=46223 RepID=A0A1I3LQY7_9BACL|nr:peptide-binding protein [Thermoflavimicrobium dichotomicum]SFI86886.1 peptide/nickel transport system substrate-binding protein [Thermoflavimicrobium dichotomicum]